MRLRAAAETAEGSFVKVDGRSWVNSGELFNDAMSGERLSKAYKLRGMVEVG